MRVSCLVEPPTVESNKKCTTCTKIRIEIDDDKCTGCGTCKFHCPKGAKIWNIEDTAMATNLRYCLGCIECVSNCPERAIEFIRCGTGCQ